MDLVACSDLGLGFSPCILGFCMRGGDQGLGTRSQQTCSLRTCHQAYASRQHVTESGGLQVDRGDIRSRKPTVFVRLSTFWHVLGCNALISGPNEMKRRQTLQLQQIWVQCLGRAFLQPRTFEPGWVPVPALGKTVKYCQHQQQQLRHFPPPTI